MMCLVIGCYHPEFSAIIGTTVTLIESLIVDDLEMWRCEEFIGHEPDYIQSRFLMPIRPEEDPLEITDVIIKEGESLMKDILILALSVLALLYIGAYTFST